MLTDAPLRWRLRISGLHRVQHEVLTDDHRFQIVVGGRRLGKTRVGVAKVVRAALERPRGYWWVTPIYSLAEEGWWVLNEFARAFPRGTTTIEKSERRIWFPRGGYVQVKSADNPWSLRGKGLGGVVLDEAAFMKPDVWPSVRPALADFQGWASFITSPNGLGNWFYELWMKTVDDPEWARWQAPTMVNPKIAPVEIESLRRQLGAVMAAQEIDAQFVSRAGAVFDMTTFRYWSLVQDAGGHWLVLHRPESEGGEVKYDPDSCITFGTCDPALTEKEGNSYFVLAIWALTPGGELLLVDRWRERAESTKHLNIVRSEYEKWLPDYIAVERSAYGTALIQQALRAGLPVKAVEAEKDKVSRARVAAARYEGHMVFHPMKAPWLYEFEQELLGFPDGPYNDQVDVTAYAAIEVASGALSAVGRVKTRWLR